MRRAVPADTPAMRKRPLKLSSVRLSDVPLLCEQSVSLLEYFCIPLFANCPPYFIFKTALETSGTKGEASENAYKKLCRKNELYWVR